MEPPAPETLCSAINLLCHLGVLDENYQLTPLGHKMSAMPLSPELARMLIVSSEFKCSNEILSIVSLLSVKIYAFPPGISKKKSRTIHKRFAHIDGDHLSMLNAYHAFKSNGEFVHETMKLGISCSFCPIFFFIDNFWCESQL